MEIGDANPSDYRVKATPPGDRTQAQVTSFTDVTGTVLRFGPIGAGTTEVRRDRS
ncbi:hypothetical protein [Streptomyces sp. NPDC051576]|uniref:hypothetical protein n=1 Tax=Streptomyces sp. NPDC051576 TaxID=3155803 RepID=UPI00342E899E